MAPPNRISCLARIEPNSVELLTNSLAAVSHVLPVVTAELRVTELGLLAPNVLVADVDGLEIDALEMVRMVRFVLPNCTIAVYTDVLKESWALACHLAGANCLLSKSTNAMQISLGLRQALEQGCFTDSSFRAAELV